MDWTVVASLATATGTLILALATFASVRAAGRSARAAERAILDASRPLLVVSRPSDETQKVMFIDGKFSLPGGGMLVEQVDGVTYLAISLRNVGTGMAVLQGWHTTPDRLLGQDPHVEPEVFHPQTRDLYLPPGDVSFWQGAVREEEHSERAVVEAIDERRAFTVDLLYTDRDGGQRVISRFGVTPVEKEGATGWLVNSSRHWNLDRVDPRAR